MWSNDAVSDQTPPSDPYGQPPSSPSGTPSWGQPQEPAQPAQDPYGAAPNPYGAPSSSYPSQQYGTPAYGTPYGSQSDPGKRPGTVTGAAITTLVLSGLVGLLMLFGTIALAASKNDILRRVQDEMDRQNPQTSFNADSVYGAILAVCIVIIVWCLIACLLAVFVLRRSNGARITLVVSCAVTAILSLLAIGSVVSGITLIASIVVIVLLFTGGANEWFSGRSRDQQQIPGQTIY